MNTIPTAIKFGAGLLFAIALVTIGLVVFTPSTDAAKSSTAELSSINNELKDQKYLVYDNNSVSGSQVTNALRKFKADGEAGKIAIQVKTGKNKAGTWYYNTFSTSSGVASGGSTTENINESTHNEYINPSGDFKASIEYDTNQVIRAIIFEQY